MGGEDQPVEPEGEEHDEPGPPNLDPIQLLTNTSTILFVEIIWKYLNNTIGGNPMEIPEQYYLWKSYGNT